MVFGFATHRRQQLEAEFLRIAGSMRQLGAERFWLTGDLARNDQRIAQAAILRMARRQGQQVVTRIRCRGDIRHHGRIIDRRPVKIEVTRQRRWRQAPAIDIGRVSCHRVTNGIPLPWGTFSRSKKLLLFVSML